MSCFNRLWSRKIVADVGVEVVVADGEVAFVLVAEFAHAQGGGVLPAEGVCACGMEDAVSGFEGGVCGGRGAVQVTDEPREALQGAQHAHVAVVAVVYGVAAAVLFGEVVEECGGRRVVVVDAGDHLHGAAVAVRESFTVEAFDFAGVAFAEVADGDVFVALGQDAGHAGRPEVFVADVLRGVAGKFRKLGVGGGCTGVRVGNEFEQGFGVVDGDVGVGEAAAETLRVWGARELAVCGGAQGFAFDADQAALQGECVVHGFTFFKLAGMIACAQGGV